MAEFISLYSGSSGNSSVVRCGSRYLIVDMGKGVRTTSAALKMINPNKIGQQPEEQEILQGLVEKTGISASKLYRIYMLMERTKKSLFTASELAEHLNLSVRGANRLLNIF